MKTSPRPQIFALAAGLAGCALQGGRPEAPAPTHTVETDAVAVLCQNALYTPYQDADGVRSYGIVSGGAYSADVVSPHPVRIDIGQTGSALMVDGVRGEKRHEMCGLVAVHASQTFDGKNRELLERRNLVPIPTSLLCDFGAVTLRHDIDDRGVRFMTGLHMMKFWLPGGEEETLPAKAGTACVVMPALAEPKNRTGTPTPPANQRIAPRVSQSSL